MSFNSRKASVYSFRSSDTNEDLSATLNTLEETPLEEKAALPETATQDILESESHGEQGNSFPMRVNIEAIN